MKIKQALLTFIVSSATLHAQQADLAQKLANPISDLISLPIQSNYDFGVGPGDGTKWTTNIQPVILDYGDKNTCAGIEVFWLPAPDRTTLLISTKEQAELICQLVRGELPVKPASIRLLKQLMEIRNTPKGTLYGKTGSGSSPDGKSKVGWFVGFFESDGKTYAFATCLQGKEMSGIEARTLTETILKHLGIF